MLNIFKFNRNKLMLITLLALSIFLTACNAKAQSTGTFAQMAILRCGKSVWCEAATDTYDTAHFQHAPERSLRINGERPVAAVGVWQASFVYPTDRSTRLASWALPSEFNFE